jgi:hypothetical protein
MRTTIINAVNAQLSQIVHAPPARIQHVCALVKQLYVNCLRALDDNAAVRTIDSLQPLTGLCIRLCSAKTRADILIDATVCGRLRADNAPIVADCLLSVANMHARLFARAHSRLTQRLVRNESACSATPLVNGLP